MSFLADPVLLLADGEAYARGMPEGAQGRAAAAVGGLTVGVFVAAGVASYLDLPWTRPLVRPLGARDGTDFMLGWPVAHGRRRKRNARLDALAAAVFATYPLWWWLGWDHGRRRRP